MNDAGSTKQPKDGAAKAGFSRREREVMDALYGLGKATAAQVHAAIPNAPSYTAVRTHLTILEKKGHVAHESDGVRYLYSPLANREDAGRTAIHTLLKTFYDNSVAQAVAAMLTEESIAPEELDRLAALISKARKEGR